MVSEARGFDVTKHRGSLPEAGAMDTETSLPRTNWCGTHELATLDQLAQPASEPEVQAALAQTAPEGKVQITGSRHSWPELVKAPGAMALNTEMVHIHQVSDDRIDMDGGSTWVDIHDALRAWVNGWIIAPRSLPVRRWRVPWPRAPMVKAWVRARSVTRPDRFGSWMPGGRSTNAMREMTTSGHFDCISDVLVC
jgi:hypothetical protein